MEKQDIVDFIMKQEDASDIWPWFVSIEEMVGNERALEETRQLLNGIDYAEGCDADRLFDALTEVFGANPALTQTAWQEM